MNRIKNWARIVSASVVALFTGTAWAAHGTYLPDTPFQLGNPASINVSAWSNANATSFTSNVFQLGGSSGNNVGSISFSYDTYTGSTVSSSTNTVGAGLSGGFTIGNGYTVVPGFTLAWAQVVLPGTTIAGSNSWSAPNGTAFPDTQGTTSPTYPFLSVAVGTAPTTGFQDFPNRFPSSGAQSWRAEDALVALNTTTHTMRIVDSFLWGFDNTAVANGVSAFTPQLWGAPSTTYVTTETNAFSATGINSVSGTNWTIQNDLTNFPVFVAVPEPTGACLLLIVGIAGLALRPRRMAA